MHKMILIVGFEPTTNGSRVRRSGQTELYEHVALVVGIEPTTNGLKVRRSEPTELHKLILITVTVPWRNGSASDSSPEG